jgi:hypothetical protein
VKLVSCPVELDGEQEDNVIVEREWEEQLRYRIELTKRLVSDECMLLSSLTIHHIEKLK